MLINISAPAAFGLCGGLWMPNVLANGQTNREAIYVDHARFSPGSKVTFFVENFVVWQALLVVLSQQFPARDHTRTIEQRTVTPARIAHYDCQIGRQLSTKHRQRSLCTIQQIAAQQKILGWVAGQRQLGKYHHMRARRLLSCTHLKHTLGVAGNIANKRIDLRHADIHHGILSHTGQAKTGERRVPYFPPVGWCCLA